MRIIDDFLFITPDKTKAELFLKQMNKGRSERNYWKTVCSVLTVSKNWLKQLWVTRGFERER
jgi:hypothetical protein